MPSRTADAASRLQALAVGGGSVSELVVALREAGIKDLEDLVRRVIGKAQAEDEALDVFAPVSEPPAGASFSHRAPKIPFTVAGVTYDPADIKRFDGQPLHFVCRRLGDATELIGFVGNEWLRAITSYAQLRQLGWLAAPVAGYATVYGGVAGGTPPPYPPSPPPYSTYGPPGQVAAGISFGPEAPSLACRLYEHPNFQGGRLRLNANRTVRDLTKIGRGFLGLGDWNDIVSSVRSDGATVVVYEHIDFAGDSLMIFPTDKQIYVWVDLPNLGWNDRVSSVQNFGKIY